MTGWRISLIACTASLALAGIWPAPAAAQCAICGITPGEASTSSEPAPIEIELEAALDFDRIIVEDGGGGAVRLLPDGTAVISGSVQPLNGRAKIGRFIIRGEPNRAILVSFPDTLELVGAKGTTITISGLVTNLPDSPSLNSNGELVVDFGGELTVRGDVDGDFRGNLMVRADYF